MNILLLSVKVAFMQAIASNLFMEGGPLFMSLILISLLLSIFFIVKGFLSSKKPEASGHKYLNLAVDSSLLGLVLGFLGSVIGLISAFDSVEAMGNPPPAMFAGGLKVSLLTAAFGLLSFVISRIGILCLRMSLSNEKKQ